MHTSALPIRRDIPTVGHRLKVERSILYCTSSVATGNRIQTMCDEARSIPDKINSRQQSGALYQSEHSARPPVTMAPEGTHVYTTAVAERQFPSHSVHVAFLRHPPRLQHFIVACCIRIALYAFDIFKQETRSDGMDQGNAIGFHQVGTTPLLRANQC
jgi:hypothetical protein